MADNKKTPGKSSLAARAEALVAKSNAQKSTVKTPAKKTVPAKTTATAKTVAKAPVKTAAKSPAKPAAKTAAPVKTAVSAKPAASKTKAAPTKGPAVYDESSIQHLEGLEHIRLRPGMYIGSLGDGSNENDGIYPRTRLHSLFSDSVESRKRFFA